MSVKFFCEGCGEHQDVIIEPMTRDAHYPDQGIWGDIICRNCKLVIHCVKVGEEGVYDFVKVAPLLPSLPDQMAIETMEAMEEEIMKASKISPVVMGTPSLEPLPLGYVDREKYMAVRRRLNRLHHKRIWRKWGPGGSYPYPSLTVTR